MPTYHRVACFDVTGIERVRGLKKGTSVFVQADFSIKEPDPDADPKTPQGQKQVLLTHGMCSEVFLVLKTFFNSQFQTF